MSICTIASDWHRHHLRQAYVAYLKRRYGYDLEDARLARLKQLADDATIEEQRRRAAHDRPRD